MNALDTPQAKTITQTNTETFSQTFKLSPGLTVNRLGYGAMRLTGQPGNFGPYADWEGGKRLLRRAAELGVDFIDTAHPYGPLTSEQIIGEAFADQGYRPVYATKGGVAKPAPGKVVVDGRPQTLKAQADESLRALRVEQIDLIQLHRPDPGVPIAESIGAYEELRHQGKVRAIGVSNVDIEQYEAARSVAPIVSVQNRFNITDRRSMALVERTRADGVAFIPYGPLGAKPFTAQAPLAGAQSPLAGIAARHGATPGQIALAWLLGLGPHVLVIPATTSIAHLEENVAAAAIALSQQDRDEIESIQTA